MFLVRNCFHSLFLARIYTHVPPAVLVLDVVIPKLLILERLLQKIHLRKCLRVYYIFYLRF